MGNVVSQFDGELEMEWSRPGCGGQCAYGEEWLIVTEIKKRGGGESGAETGTNRPRARTGVLRISLNLGQCLENLGWMLSNIANLLARRF